MAEVFRGLQDARPKSWRPPVIHSDTGVIDAPECCGNPMHCVGECENGCCSDYQCRGCYFHIRIEVRE